MRGKVEILAVAWVLVLSMASGCVLHKQYRKCDEAGGDGFKLAYLELDDHGEFWDRRQLERVRDEIVEANESEAGVKAGAVVIVYVHGWKHNASESDSNLASFRKILTGLAQAESAFVKTYSTRPARPILGIYLAWRGDSLALIEPLKSASYFDRDITAGRVAGPSGTEALYGLMKWTRGNSLSKCIVVGHSMGAIIVQRALTQAFQGAIIDSSSESDVRAPADVVLLINPAISAIETKQFVEMMDWWNVTVKQEIAKRFVCNSGEKQWRPLIVSMTSEGDTATRGIFRFARRLDSLPQRFRRGRREFYIRPAAAIPSLQSHVLVFEERGSNGTSTSAYTPIEACEEDLCNKKLQDGAKAPLGRVCFRAGSARFLLEEKFERANRTPFWVISVPREVVAGHNDIFNSRLTDFIHGILLLTGSNKPQDMKPALNAKEEKTSAP
jgi:pimeloyl-ACP methyl ester carboxylesterase